MTVSRPTGVPHPGGSEGLPGAARCLDFFVIGVQKGGTTALDALLRAHPQIGMAATKELHFFDDDSRDWSAPDFAPLHAQFDWSAPATRVRGEATPIYLYWPEALQRLRSYHPGARLLVALRHPVTRAFSAWRMERTRGAEPLPFAEAVSPAGRRRVSEAPGGVHRIFSYVERGLYARQIERLLRIFPRTQLHVLRTDRLWSEPEPTLAAIDAFLGVDPRLRPRVARAYVAPVMSRDFGTIPANVLAMLLEEFRPEIERTCRLTGIDLRDWLDPGYQEPMRRP